MTTNKKIKKGSANELIEVLSFIPQTYTIELSGFGGEIVMGKVNHSTYDYLLDNLIEVDELVDDIDNDLGIPSEHRIFPNGAWYECNDICHESGVEFSDNGCVTVFDENGNSVWTSNLNPMVLKRNGCRVDLQNVTNVNDQPNDSVVFVGRSDEKGVFFKGDINLSAPFDPRKLGFGYASINSWDIGSGVEYNDEYIENDDLSINYLSSAYKLVVVDNSPTTVEESTYRPNESEYSDFWPSTINPVYTGWYQCIYRTDGHITTTGRLLWIGDAWMAYRHKKLIEVPNIKLWRGLNWDTTDMKNQPGIINREE